MTLSGKTAVVTGGSRGIGRAVVRRLVAAGARVVFTYAHREPAEVPPGTVAVRADQADLASLEMIFEQVADGFDILVNNVGVGPRIPIAELTADQIDRVFTINLRFPLLAIKAAVPLLRDGGRIINISTLNTVLGAPGLSLYCSSKAALEQVTVVASKELGPRAITVNTVSPGATDTDMLRAHNEADGLAQGVAMTALRRLGTPDDIAAVVAFLVSADGGWITGQNIRATGGLIL
ncbi:SDR family oxidoreductase [Paractinoplanes ferrugineus]|uniref:3-oxoacyl-ACP reductase n=1 Tax=Paractinoplanes ferrugineus TaxID=113564 RepID=A0A919J2D3_9ACTN|nr:SDR family oxidoreductase [Actinoplanes ferrugineus]GIE11184.1 3-oxoacyl-ACP reductase [Actinoplanes ferrugineus]